METGDHDDNDRNGADRSLRGDDHSRLWRTALCLFRNGDPSRVALLFRLRVPLSASASHELADLFYPDPERATYRLELKKFRNRNREKLEKLLPIARQVLEAERAGEKRYMAVERISKQIDKTQRHVWDALAFHKEYYQGGVNLVTDITQSGTFAPDTTVVTIHSQTGSGAVLRPFITRDGTVYTFHIEETGKDYWHKDSITFTDVVNGGRGSGLIYI